VNRVQAVPDIIVWVRRTVDLTCPLDGMTVADAISLAVDVVVPADS
jgi:hypothetical protein